MERSVPAKKNRNKSVDSKISNSTAMRFHLGDVFVDVTRRLLGGSKQPSDSPHGDIHHRKLDARIEVKASGSDNSIQAFLCQLDRFLELRGFPEFSHCWYVLFQYRNHRDMRLYRVVKRHSDLLRELSHRTVRMVLVDADVLSAMRDSQSVEYMRSGKDSSMLMIRNEMLSAFERDPEGRLKDLQLTHVVPWKTRVRVTLQGCAFYFPVLVLLPPEQCRKVTRHFRRFTERPAKGAVI